ncbi:hypothetical protein EYF80_050035 [Liparis tanakae]|uniref:Uncharacterized protein n=1 Tax=Liparis tanakae TaxID=230148 RepID=A0A4Z2FFX1_9TELE|nr:hypothetical protein EYF80_050035 [Liparis tanakae]
MDNKNTEVTLGNFPPDESQQAAERGADRHVRSPRRAPDPNPNDTPTRRVTRAASSSALNSHAVLQRQKIISATWKYEAVRSAAAERKRRSSSPERHEMIELMAPPTNRGARVLPSDGDRMSAAAGTVRRSPRDAAGPRGAGLGAAAGSAPSSVIVPPAINRSSGGGDPATHDLFPS